MMSENLKLVRALFPLLFQFLILLLDYTLDSINTTSHIDDNSSGSLTVAMERIIDK